MNYKTTRIDEAARTDIKPEAILEEADAEQDFDNTVVELLSLADRLYDQRRDRKRLRDESQKRGIKSGGGEN